MMEKSAFLRALDQGLNASGLALSDRERELFWRHVELVDKANQRMNLTRIADEEDVAIKHVVDSLMVERVNLEHIETALDLGSGAGFPGIPLAIVHPLWRWTLVDTVGKKVAFLSQTIEQLGLENVSAVHGRAEQLGHDNQYRERFNLVTARAVAGLSALLELCIPFVRINGTFVAYKGRDGDQELVEADVAQKLLGARLVKKIGFELPCNAGTRNILVFRKTNPTPKDFPRRPAQIRRSPL